MSEQSMENPMSDSDPAMVEDSQASKRALEAYDTIPGDSEAKVDYPPGTVFNQTFLPKYEAEDSYELEVQMIVRLPDGVTIEYREAVVKESADDYDFPEAAAMADQVNNVIQNRIG